MHKNTAVALLLYQTAMSSEEVNEIKPQTAENQIQIKRGV